MEDNFQVCFTPSGRQFKGEFGDTLLQVAQDAGVAIRSLMWGVWPMSPMLDRGF